MQIKFKILYLSMNTDNILLYLKVNFCIFFIFLISSFLLNSNNTNIIFISILIIISMIVYVKYLISK